MVNRNPVCQWFITFPRWKEYEDIKEFEKISPKSKWGYAVKESHEDGGIHYHLMLKLSKGITKVKMIEYWKTMFPNDWKRIDVEPTRDFRAAHNYLAKEQLEVYEWGQGMKLPVWMQVLKDEWTNPELISRVNAEEKRQRARQDEHDKWLYECEHPICIICNKRDFMCCDYWTWKI